MANKIVAVPGIGTVSFPDGMSDADINSAIEQQLGANKPAAVPLSAMRPQDMAQQAMQQSGINRIVSSPATPPNVNMQAQAPTRLGAYGNAIAQNNENMNKVTDAVGQDAAGMVKGMGRTALQVLASPNSPEYALGQAMIAPVVQSAQDKNKSTAETLGVATGVNSPAIKQAAQAGDYPSLIGHSIMPLVTAGLAGEFARAGFSKLTPNAARAGADLSEVERVAGNNPVDVNAPGDVAMRTKELASSGGTMPKVVNDFIKRVTDPTQPPLTLGEARDFYKNATRLSSAEFNKLTPVMQRQAGQFADALNDSITDSAEQSGLGSKYSGAIEEYAKAMKLRGVKQDVIDKILKPAAKAVPYGVGAATGATIGYGTYKAMK